MSHRHHSVFHKQKMQRIKENPVDTPIEAIERQNQKVDPVDTPIEIIERQNKKLDPVNTEDELQEERNNERLYGPRIGN